MMKFNKFFYWLKKDKIYLSLFIAVCVCAALSLAVIIFDIVQLVMVSSNSAKLSNAFLALNIIAMVINILLILAIILVVVLKKNR